MKAFAILLIAICGFIRQGKGQQRAFMLNPSTYAQTFSDFRNAFYNLKAKIEVPSIIINESSYRLKYVFHNPNSVNFEDTNLQSLLNEIQQIIEIKGGRGIFEIQFLFEYENSMGTFLEGSGNLAINIGQFQTKMK